MEFHIKHWNGMFRDFVSTMSRGVFVSRRKDACEPTPELLELCHQANSRGKMQQSIQTDWKPIETATWCDWKVDMMLTCWHVDMVSKSTGFPTRVPGRYLGCNDVPWTRRTLLIFVFFEKAFVLALFLSVHRLCTGCAPCLLLVFQVSPHRPVLEDQTSWTDLARWQGSDGQLIDSWSLHRLHRLHRRQVAQVHRTAELLEALDVICVWFGICQHFRDPPMQCRLQFIYIYILSDLNCYNLLYLLALHDRKRIQWCMA